MKTHELAAVPDNFIARKGALPQMLMHAAISELAAAGESALAAKLEALRVKWSAEVRRAAALGPRVTRRKRLQYAFLRLGDAVGVTPLEQAKACVAGMRAEAEGTDCA